MAGAFFAGAFFATGAFLAGAFFAGAFFAAAAAFFAGAFFAGAFFATEAFFAGTFFAGAAFVEGAFFAGALVAVAFFTGAEVFAAAFLAAPAVPLVAAAGGRRATTLRAAEAALPARDRVVLRAMRNLPGIARERVEGCGRRSEVQAPSMGEGISVGGLSQSRHA